MAVRQRRFYQVLEALMTDGIGEARAYRANWNGTKLEGNESMYITLDNIPGYLPCLTLTTPQGTQVPWLATSTDLLAEDWVISYA